MRVRVKVGVGVELGVAMGVAVGGRGARGAKAKRRQVIARRSARKEHKAGYAGRG